MNVVIKSIRNFLTDGRGAVSVEYVVLAAAATAVALASTDIVKLGLQAYSNTVEGELSGEAPTVYAGLTYSSGFDNGAHGWEGANGTSISGIGNVLGPIGGSAGVATVSRTFDIDPAAGQVTFDFDLLAMDSLDNESGIIYVDGEEIGRLTRNHATSGVVFTAASGVDADRYSITQTTIQDDVELGGTDRWRDHTSAISITVTNPGSTVNFGFGSTANQATDDESFSIDNFRATGLLDPDRV